MSGISPSFPFSKLTNCVNKIASEERSQKANKPAHVGGGNNSDFLAQ